MQLPFIHFDCKHFEGDKPCEPNKKFGIFCSNCNYYEKDITIPNEFPEIQAAFHEVNPAENKKIIIIKLDAVGDVLRTTSILPSLKKKYADSEIIWITKEKSFPVLKNNSLIDEIYSNDDEELSCIYNDLFDIAINLDSGKESCQLMANINANEQFGFTLSNGKPYPMNELANEWYLLGVNDNSKKANTKTYHKIIHEICGLEYENTKPFLGFTREMKKKSDKIRDNYRLERYKEFILINLGGGNRWQYKKWTKEGFISLINSLAENRNKAIGIIAGDEDIDFYNEVSENLKDYDNIINFGCGFTTEDFISLIYLADKVFTSDSLAFHIAASLDKYCIVIVGPTSHTELDVFGNGKIVYSEKVDCLCCYLNTCPKIITCMNTISAHEIMSLLA